ncbi:MAG: DUF4389 domain-containing protein [Candidatus Daviesbacteria bacterium]|nr:DUF4389 domain-containing protein [Candidatus Daviesbacteria bacterium]
MEKFFEDLISQNPKRFYPDLKIDHIQNPNRFFAFPLFGGLVKIIILIPVFIEIAFLMIFLAITAVINSFVVLFTGKYWNFNYSYILGVLRLLAKTGFYFEGLTNKYPGFGFTTLQSVHGFTLDMKKPENPSRFYAIPLLGGLVRIVLLIPYFIWVQVLGNASFLGTVISSFFVLFKGRYPESTYELDRDTLRVSTANYAYMLGFSDTYPSFWISFNHKAIKIILLAFGILYSLNSGVSNFDNSSTKTPFPLEQSPIACTMEVKECPDGSSVGRIPPSCSFAPCPISQ